MTGPLSDVRVVSFCQVGQGPMATQLLGDMGADVIKIEPPGGEFSRAGNGLSMANELADDENTTFLSVNRNKRSAVLDMTDEADREVVLDLIDDADVVTENFRPGTMARLGLDYETLRERNPALVYASATGYGDDGPYEDLPGQDLLIQSLCGLMSMTGTADDPPTPTGTTLVDFYSALLLAFGVVVAVHHSRRTGEGQRVNVDLLSSAMHLLSEEICTYANSGNPPERSEVEGMGHPYFHAPYGVYETADGHITISLSPLSELGAVLGMDRLAEITSPETAYEERDALKRDLDSRFRERTTDEWIDQLREADVWCAPVQTLPEAVEDPQVRHNEMVTSVGHPTIGELRLAGIPIRFSETPGEIDRYPPRQGEHTDEIRDMVE
ncbi:MAG: CaiB/BaiF CoA transferase family protein [Haloplanus sp.]